MPTDGSTFQVPSRPSPVVTRTMRGEVALAAGSVEAAGSELVVGVGDALDEADRRGRRGPQEEVREAHRAAREERDDDRTEPDGEPSVAEEGRPGGGLVGWHGRGHMILQSGGCPGDSLAARCPYCSRSAMRVV